MELGNPCNSAEQALTLAHYCVDFGTPWLSHGSVRKAIVFAINLGNATASTVDATFDRIDCDDGSGVTVTFSGRIRVTK